jgi:hypothetical protein
MTNAKQQIMLYHMNHINHSSDMFPVDAAENAELIASGQKSAEICERFLLQKPLLPIAFSLQKHCCFYCS